MQKKTLVKGCLISLACLFVALVSFGCFILYLFTGTSEEEKQAYGGDHAENRRRTNLAVSLKIDVEEYYKQHKQYPRITELYSPPDMLLIDYLKSGVISYTVEKKNFCVRYIHSDARFHQSGQKYALSWNGKQYCSENQHLTGVSKDWQADGAGFYTYDRH